MAADASRRGGSTTYEDFCQHLDTEDHGTRRAFELLLSVRPASPSPRVTGVPGSSAH